MAIYVGVLKKLDRGLLESAAAALASEGGCLVLIGPDVEWLDVVIRKCPNIHYLGTRSSQEVPAYLQNADVGLMLYDREKAPVYLGQNPLKLYEYAAARLPVISTPHKEFQFIKPPVWIVESENDVMNALQKLSNEGAKVAEEMGEFAERYSWKNCVETANCVIRTLLPYEG